MLIVFASRECMGEERRLKKFDEKEFFFRGGIIYFFSLEV